MNVAVLTDHDPSTLSVQQRRALRTVRKHHCFRRPGGFGRPPHSVSLDVATSLIAKGLMRQEYSGRSPALVLTGMGEHVLAVMESRIEQRRRH